MRDVARAHVLAAENPAASGRYIVAAPGSASPADISSWLRQRFPEFEFAEGSEVRRGGKARSMLTPGIRTSVSSGRGSQRNQHLPLQGTTAAGGALKYRILPQPALAAGGGEQARCRPGPRAEGAGPSADAGQGGLLAVRGTVGLCTCKYPALQQPCNR